MFPTGTNKLHIVVAEGVDAGADRVRQHVLRRQWLEHGFRNCRRRGQPDRVVAALEDRGHLQRGAMEFRQQRIGRNGEKRAAFDHVVATVGLGAIPERGNAEHRPIHEANEERLAVALPGRLPGVEADIGTMQRRPTCHAPRVAGACSISRIEATSAHDLAASASAQAGIKPQRSMTPSTSPSCMRITGM